LSTASKLQLALLEQRRHQQLQDAPDPKFTGSIPLALRQNILTKHFARPVRRGAGVFW
jgi:hypothetical protein